MKSRQRFAAHFDSEKVRQHASNVGNLVRALRDSSQATTTAVERPAAGTPTTPSLCSDPNQVVAYTLANLTYGLPNPCLAECFSPYSSCPFDVLCWFCEYVPTEVPLIASAFYQPSFSCAVCPCMLFAGQWGCPTQQAGPYPQVPQVFGPDYQSTLNWYYTVGRLIPANPALAPMGFEFTVYQFNSVPNVYYPAATSFVVQFAITNPNAQPPFGYLRGSDAARTFPPFLVNFAFNASTGALSISSFPTPTERAEFGVTHSFNLSTTAGAAGKVGTKWLLVASSVAVFPGNVVVPMSILLHLVDQKGAVLHGVNGITSAGYLQCSTDTYLSLSHLAVDTTQENVVVVNETVIPLSGGVAWMDRELSYSVLEDYNGGHATCWGNGVNAVNLSAVAAGQQRVLNATGWLYTNIHIPELDIEFLLAQLSDVSLSTYQSGDKMHQFYNSAGGFGTLVTGSNPATGLAEKIDLSDDDIQITILATQPFPAYDALNLSQVVAPLYFPTAVHFLVQNDLVFLDLICEDIRYTSTNADVLQNYFSFTGGGEYLEGLAGCQGFVVYRGGERIRVSLAANFWAYLERTTNQTPADRPCVCPNGLNA